MDSHSHFLGNFGVFFQGFGMGMSSSQQEKSPGKSIFPIFEWDFSMEPVAGQLLGGKNHLEKPFFPIFEHFLSMSWVSKQEKITWKKTFSLF